MITNNISALFRWKRCFLYLQSLWSVKAFFLNHRYVARNAWLDYILHFFPVQLTVIWLYSESVILDK